MTLSQSPFLWGSAANDLNEDNFESCWGHPSLNSRGVFKPIANIQNSIDNIISIQLIVNQVATSIKVLDVRSKFDYFQVVLAFRWEMFEVEDFAVDFS